MRKLLLLLSLSLLVSVPASAQFYYAPYLQLSSTVDVSTAMGNLDSVQTLRANIIPLRVKANGYGTPPDLATYAVVAPNTTGDDAPASTLPPNSWTSGGCIYSFTLDGNGRNIWFATAYASMADALSARAGLSARFQAAAYVLTPPLEHSPAVLLMPSIGIACP